MIRLILVIEVHVKDMFVVFTLLVRDTEAETNPFENVVSVIGMLNVIKHVLLRVKVHDL